MDELEQLQQPQYDPHPVKHGLGMAAGYGIAVKSLLNAQKLKKEVPDYKQVRKKYDKILKELKIYETENKMGDALKEYVKNHSLKEDVDKIKNHLKNDKMFETVSKVRGFKALGALGLGIGGYNTYKMAVDDINRHPVVENI